MSIFSRQLALRYPIVQAPMAGVSTPALAAAVTNAGGLGSIAVGHLDVSSARDAIAAVRGMTNGPFNVNVFCHRPARRDPQRESEWIQQLAPLFRRFRAEPPKRLREIYRSYLENQRMQELLLQEQPAVVSFHFGLPTSEHIQSLRAGGSFVIATATNANEGQAAEEAGVDAVVAQGYEAGGHRGVYDLASEDQCMSTLELTTQLAQFLRVPIVSAGGIMDAQGVSEALDAGASAVQVGTAFLLCPEISIDAGYRSAIHHASKRGTIMTEAISGRPARSIVNEFTQFGETVDVKGIIPDYPVAYDAGKSLRFAATAADNHEFGAYWAGTGVDRCKPISAAEIIAQLAGEPESNALRL